MSVTPPVIDIHVQRGAYALSSFDKAMAAVVASWVRDDHELFWLAPNTPPPITAAKVAAWIGPNACPLVLRREGLSEPLGYLELNLMPDQNRHFWMGHCVIRPDRREQGLGQLLVDMMLDEAFQHRDAARVSLVVFPGNVPAIRCYRRAGFVDVAEQVKYFYTTGRQHRMLRMSIDDCLYQQARRQRIPE